MSDTHRLELSTDTVVDYLERRGVVTGDDTPTVRSLGGGVSNRVLMVSWGDGCLVVKQPRPNLAVEDDWPADVGRVHNEAAATRAYASVLDAAGIDDVHVPSVSYEDEHHNVIAVECAPDGASTWKRELLAGDVDADVAAAVGRTLGAVHDSAAGNATLRAQFENKRPFDQLRIDPYHRTTAERHPDVAAPILDEVERIRSVERTLVHGDYSPKNVLVPRSGGGAEPWVIDFEVAHWGDPAFDTAFMLNHLFIKSVYNHQSQDAYLDAVTAFWDAYVEQVDWDVESETTTELGILMLARVDGKSPVEYVERRPIADALRRIAKRTLTEETTTLSGFASTVREEAQSL